MKKSINLLMISLIALGIIIAGVAVAIGFTNEKVNYNEVTEVRIGVSNGLSCYGNLYELTYSNGTWLAAHSKSTFEKSSENKVAVDEEFVTRIIRSLKKYKVHKWDDFSLKYEIRKKMGEYITDANTYDFYMQFIDGSIIQISSYNAGPNNFMLVLNAFEKEYETLFAESE